MTKHQPKQNIVIKGWEYYKALYEKVKESKKRKKGRKNNTHPISPKKNKEKREKKPTKTCERFQHENRSNPTPAEVKFNILLKSILKPRGIKYDTQKVFLNGSKFFLIDFYVYARTNIAIEIDGGYHDTPNQKQYDKWRQSIIEQSGAIVIRFTNNQVINRPDWVIQILTEEIDQNK